MMKCENPSHNKYEELWIRAECDLLSAHTYNIILPRVSLRKTKKMKNNSQKYNERFNNLYSISLSELWLKFLFVFLVLFDFWFWMKMNLRNLRWWWWVKYLFSTVFRFSGSFEFCRSYFFPLELKRTRPVDVRSWTNSTRKRDKKTGRIRRRSRTSEQENENQWMKRKTTGSDLWSYAKSNLHESQNERRRTKSVSLRDEWQKKEKEETEHKKKLFFCEKKQQPQWKKYEREEE